MASALKGSSLGTAWGESLLWLAVVACRTWSGGSGVPLDGAEGRASEAASSSRHPSLQKRFALLVRNAAFCAKTLAEAASQASAGGTQEGGEATQTLFRIQERIDGATGDSLDDALQEEAETPVSSAVAAATAAGNCAEALRSLLLLSAFFVQWLLTQALRQILRLEKPSVRDCCAARTPFLTSGCCLPLSATLVFLLLRLFALFRRDFRRGGPQRPGEGLVWKRKKRWPRAQKRRAS